MFGGSPSTADTCIIELSEHISSLNDRKMLFAKPLFIVIVRQDTLWLHGGALFNLVDLACSTVDIPPAISN